MKKNYLNIATIVALTLTAVFTSCSDNDSPDKGGNKIDETNVVKDDASAVALVNGIYSNWQPLSSSFSFVIELNSNKLISFEGEESEAGPLNSRYKLFGREYESNKRGTNEHIFTIAHDGDSFDAQGNHHVHHINHREEIRFRENVRQDACLHIAHDNKCFHSRRHIVCKLRPCAHCRDSGRACATRGSGANGLSRPHPEHRARQHHPPLHGGEQSSIGRPITIERTIHSLLLRAGSGSEDANS